MADFLDIRGLTKHFGGILAVEDLSLSVAQGTVLGIIGPNGAGKTTVFNLITGVYPPSEGELLLEGQSLAGLPPHTIVQRGVARTFQNIRLFRNLTVRQNIVTALDLRQKPYSLAQALLCNPPFVESPVKAGERALRERAMTYLELVGIEAQADRRADNLPYGLQRKLELARALALEPKLLLLDEPAAGMNPDESMELCALIRSIQRQLSLTVLVIEHHMDLVMELCDRLCVLSFGKKLAEGTPAEIQSDPAVLKAYLGEGWVRA
ncbi:MAG: ABC transporter ATP-binding protein [Clostridiales bacterium]|nr:ABC transporter ATP-binding protein [Clostridiales bacterium]